MLGRPAAKSRYNNRMGSDTAQPRTTKTTLTALIEPDARDPDEILTGKLRLSLSLFHDGVRMKRASLERAFPEASRRAIDDKLRAWLLDRPHDRPGVPAAWPRR